MRKLLFATAVVFGDDFSPAEAERTTGLTFEDAHERGSVYDRGRFKGKPWPFGHAVVEAPPDVDSEEKLSWLLNTVLPHIGELKRLGVTQGKVHLYYVHDGQCNLDYEPEAVARVAQSGWNFCISCSEDPSYFPEL